MKTKDGKTIVSCDGRKNVGNCVTCMWLRNWVNTRSLHEGDEDYCSCPDVTVSDNENATRTLQ